MTHARRRRRRHPASRHRPRRRYHHCCGHTALCIPLRAQGRLRRVACLLEWRCPLSRFCCCLHRRCCRGTRLARRLARRCHVAGKSRHQFTGYHRISTLALALIAHAVDAGDLVQSLHALQRRRAAGNYDVLSMYGAYINTPFVCARDVLRNAAETQAVNETMRREGLRAPMWNLTALDLNESPPEVEWAHRLGHNLFRAGTPGERIYQAPLSTMLGPIGASFDTELATARQDTSRLSLRRGVTYVTRLRGRQILSWAYIAFSIVISCVCARKNWPRRDNAFERAKDAVDVATLLLVSVFGLVKLTSEDPTALKSLARGRAPVEDLEQAGRFLRTGAVLWGGKGYVAMEGIQRLLGVEVRGVEWARAQGCCYGRAVLGEELDAMAAKVETLKKGGFFFMEGICKRPYFWNTCVKVEGVALEVASFGGASEMECELDFTRAAHYAKVA